MAESEKNYALPELADGDGAALRLDILAIEEERDVAAQLHHVLDVYEEQRINTPTTQGNNLNQALDVLKDVPTYLLMAGACAVTMAAEWGFSKVPKLPIRKG